MAETAQIEIELNGQIQIFSSGTTLATVVTAQGADPGAIATAVNDAFVARHMRQSCLLRQGDVVLFFSPMVGG